ncbi:phage tail protein [Klebsiella aerogenes]|uniref:phage tail-collar fiber domain-containing protein n=1 Tax=Klebsiella aerogenes TaxID=548 RepID=UPI00351CF460
MSDYYIIITDAGAALEAAAHASGTPVTLTEFAAGDGGGAAVTPDPTRTTLVNEVYRGNISSLTINADDNTVLNAQCIIPADSGGYTVREIGIYADDGTLYAIGNYIEQVKPDPTTGTAITMDVSVQLAVSDTADITLYLNPGDYLTKEEADELYLKLTGGAMTGPIGFKDGDPSRSYALNRQAVWSLMDCYNALPLMNSTWNKVGTIDTTVNQYGRVSFTLIGSMSHDVGMAVQTGFVNIDIIGTTGSNSPGITLTIFKPDEAKGTPIADAVLSASPTQDKCFDLWIKTQSAVAGIMPFGKQSTPGYLTFYSTFETTDVAPEPSTETGVVYLVSANKDGKVNIKGDFTVAGKTNLNGDVNISAGHAVYSKSPFLLETDDPTGVPDDEFITTPVVKFRLNGRGALDDPEGAFANIYYEEHVGTDNALCIALNGFGGRPVMRFVNSSSSDSSQSAFQFPGQIIPGNYGNFDARYLGAGTAYVQNVRQGGQGSFLIPQGVDIFAPDGCYFMGYHAEGDKAEDDTFFYRPIQIKFNGAWSTIGYNTASPDPQINVVKSGRKKLTSLNNLMMYRPDENWPENIQNFIDDSGYVWSDAAKNLSGNIFIAYDADGIIRYIEKDATAITPLNLSVAGLDSVPDDCSIDGTWIFDGEKVYQDISTVDKRLLARNTNKRDSLTAKAVSAITSIQSSAAVGNPRNDDPENLLALQQYVDQLRDVDLTLASPAWPEPPSYLS